MALIVIYITLQVFHQIQIVVRGVAFYRLTVEN